ncbi:hypothetical protein EK904_004266 [Melospiza melodia maxima]|nr:hypothetical protein EK904_004266 [Melospiza melodia maxima]
MPEIVLEDTTPYVETQEPLNCLSKNFILHDGSMCPDVCFQLSLRGSFSASYGQVAKLSQKVEISTFSGRLKCKEGCGAVLSSPGCSAGLRSAAPHWPAVWNTYPRQGELLLQNKGGMRRRERPGHRRETGAAPVRQMKDKSRLHCRQKNGVTAGVLQGPLETELTKFTTSVSWLLGCDLDEEIDPMPELLCTSGFGELWAAHALVHTMLHNIEHASGCTMSRVCNVDFRIQGYHGFRKNPTNVWEPLLAEKEANSLTQKLNPGYFRDYRGSAHEHLPTTTTVVATLVQLQ